MKLLAVLYCFPPLLVPAAICYLKLMAGLRRLGVDVDIVVIDPASFHAPDPGLIDGSLDRLVPADLGRVAVRSPESDFLVRLLKRFDPVYRLVYPRFEPKKREWTGPALRLLDRMRLDAYDAVLTCSQPHANHLIGLALKRRTGLPWVAYFSDPWSRNPYARFRSPGVAAFNARLEAEVLDGADHVLFTSDEMLRHTAVDYPDLPAKSGVLPHAFVPEWYGLETAADARPPGMMLLHTGHFYGPRTPMPLVRALERLNARASLDGRLHVACYGGMGADHRAAIEGAGLGNVIRVHPVIPYLRSLALMGEADCTLLIDAAVEAGSESVFLPSKLVDYLGAGKPVIAVTPPEGASARVTREAGGVVCDVGDADAIEALLADLAAGTRPAPLDREAVRGYHYEAVAGRLVDVIRDTVK
jgi:glycosyltransferase involved in cell wall biosynthesis